LTRARSLAKSLLGSLRRDGETQFPEHHEVGRERSAIGHRRHGQCYGQVGCRLGDADPSHGRHEELGRRLAEHTAHRGAAGEHGEEQVGARRIEAERLRPWRAVATAPAWAEEGLDFHEERAAALQDRQYHGAGHAQHAVTQHERSGVWNRAQAVVAHLEDADLTGRPEAVLH
jgi:hypothetical protein